MRIVIPSGVTLLGGRPQGYQAASEENEARPAATELTALKVRLFMAWKRNSSLGPSSRTQHVMLFTPPSTVLQWEFPCLFPSNLCAPWGHRLRFIYSVGPSHYLVCYLI